MTTHIVAHGKLDLLEEDVLRVSHFIDCNCLAEQGANAMRWTDEIQRAFYNGWIYCTHKGPYVCS